MELAAKALQLREQHQAPKPPKAAPKATRYLVEFDDGTAMFAEGELADLLYRYFKECELQCTTHRLTIYDGPVILTVPIEDARKALGL